MDPVIYCTMCSLVRRVLLHLRAEFPPDAARRWFRKHHKGCNGEVKYRAGLSLGGVIKGQ